MRGLYAIIDAQALTRRGLDIVRFAEAVLATHPSAAQLRDKRGRADETLSLLRVLVPLAHRHGVPLFANDRSDLAVLSRCDGVHLGQDDIPPRAVRSEAPQLSVGLSTHAVSEVERALDEPIDYLAIGPVFPTSNKAKPDPTVGLDGLAALAALARVRRPGLPVVAIGGISADSARATAAIVDACAVIGALLPDSGAQDPYEATFLKAKSLHLALGGAA